MDSHTPDTVGDVGQGLAESLRDSIRSRTNGRIRDLEVTVNGSTIVISGRTSRYYYKQLATSAALLSDKPHDLTNQIEVEA